MSKSPSPQVKRLEDESLQEVPAGTATRSQVLLGPADGMPHFFMRRFVMQQGGGMPRHTNAVEHEQFVLAGRARISIGDETHEVRRDHVVFIPAGVPHSYEVLEAPFEFLCVVPPATPDGFVSGRSAEPKKTVESKTSSNCE